MIIIIIRNKQDITTPTTFSTNSLENTTFESSYPVKFNHLYDIILKNNRYNSAQIMYACKIYIDLFKYLRYMNEDCNKYINVVKEKMIFLSEIYPKDKVLENNINEILNQL